MSFIKICNHFQYSHEYILFTFRRGIPAQPILDGFCGNYELGMPRSAINYPAFNYDTPIWTNVTTTAPRASTVPTQWKKAPSETGH